VLNATTMVTKATMTMAMGTIIIARNFARSVYQAKSAPSLIVENIDFSFPLVKIVCSTTKYSI